MIFSDLFIANFLEIVIVNEFQKPASILMKSCLQYEVKRVMRHKVLLFTLCFRL